MNIALYGGGGRRWAMTERRRASVSRDENRLSIGPSNLVWEGDVLTIRFDEVTSPRPSRLRGVMRLHPQAINDQAFSLDTEGRHRWRPIAPRARVEVDLENPALSWTGDGYFDTNAGAEPLEDGFKAWDWSRAHLPADTLMFYDVQRRDGDLAHLALRIGPEGNLRSIEPPPRTRLAATSWGIARQVRGGTEDAPRLRQTLEDTPFYSRSSLLGRYGGEQARIVHESLSLNRLRSPIVKAMLPVRMPRIFW